MERNLNCQILICFTEYYQSIKKTIKQSYKTIMIIDNYRQQISLYYFHNLWLLLHFCHISFTNTNIRIEINERESIYWYIYHSTFFCCILWKGQDNPCHLLRRHIVPTHRHRDNLRPQMNKCWLTSTVKILNHELCKGRQIFLFSLSDNGFAKSIMPTKCRLPLDFIRHIDGPQHPSHDLVFKNEF